MIKGGKLNFQDDDALDDADDQTGCQAQQDGRDDPPVKRGHAPRAGDAAQRRRRADGEVAHAGQHQAGQRRGNDEGKAGGAADVDQVGRRKEIRVIEGNDNIKNDHRNDRAHFAGGDHFLAEIRELALCFHKGSLFRGYLPYFLSKKAGRLYRPAFACKYQPMSSIPKRSAYSLALSFVMTEGSGALTVSTSSP